MICYRGSFIERLRDLNGRLYSVADFLKDSFRFSTYDLMFPLCIVSSNCGYLGESFGRFSGSYSGMRYFSGIAAARRASAAALMSL